MHFLFVDLNGRKRWRKINVFLLYIMYDIICPEQICILLIHSRANSHSAHSLQSKIRILLIHYRANSHSAHSLQSKFAFCSFITEQIRKIVAAQLSFCSSFGFAKCSPKNIYALKQACRVHFPGNTLLWIVLKKIQFQYNIFLAYYVCCVYTKFCCGMIAVKREVATDAKATVGFPWSECQVRKLTTSHCTNNQVCLGQKRRDVK